MPYGFRKDGTKLGFQKGHIVSLEMRKKMSLLYTGKKLSEETKKKLSENSSHYWLGKKKPFLSERNKKIKGWKQSDRAKKKMSMSHLGKKFTKEHRKKISEANKGEKSHYWKGGVSLENQKIRGSVEFSLWREAVFARDNWTCQKTMIKGGKLHPHHIQNFAQYPELRFAIDNGITLSEKSHKEFHHIYGIKNNTKEQLEEFLNFLLAIG